MYFYTQSQVFRLLKIRHHCWNILSVLVQLFHFSYFDLSKYYLYYISYGFSLLYTSVYQHLRKHCWKRYKNRNWPELASKKSLVACRDHEQKALMTVYESNQSIFLSIIARHETYTTRLIDMLINWLHNTQSFTFRIETYRKHFLQAVPSRSSCWGYSCWLLPICGKFLGFL